MRRPLLLGLTLAAVAAAGSAATAQEVGGIPIVSGAGGGPAGLAQLLPITLSGLKAADLQSRLTPADRRVRHQDMTTRLRGDAGYLQGFVFGQPLALSRARPLPPPPPLLLSDPLTGGLVLPGPVVIDNFDGPIAVANGDGNVIQQQVTSGSGPIGQQQVATVLGDAADGEGSPAVVSRDKRATNIVGRSGNIVQHTRPIGGRRGTGRR